MSIFPDLLHQSLDGIFAFDASQTVTFWNPACESLTGIPAGDAIGRSCDELLRGENLKGQPLCRRNCQFSALSAGGPPPACLPMRIGGADGNKIQVSVGTLLLPSGSGNQWSVVHIMRRGRETDPASLFAGAHPRKRVSPANDERHATAHPPGSHAGASLLTQREREVLCLLAEGKSSEVIGEQLHISATTVRNHIQRLMAKLDVHTRLEAVACARRLRLA